MIYKIRDANLADAENIVHMHIKSWQETYPGIVDQKYLDELTDSYESRLSFRTSQLISKAGALFLVAESDNKIIGFCEAGAARGGKHGAGEIYAIYLLEKYKGSGLGQDLWNKVVDYLRKNNLLPYCVSVLKNNGRARKFYEKNGGRMINKSTIEVGDKMHESVEYIFYN